MQAKLCRVRQWLRCRAGRPFGFLSVCAALACVVTHAYSGTNEPVSISIQNARMKVALGRTENGAIVSLVDCASKAEFAAQQKTPRLFNLTFSKKAETGGERLYLSSRDAKVFSADVSNGVAILDYDGLGEWPARVRCTVTARPDEPLMRWRISVKIPDSLILEEVQFPFVVLRAPLGESMEDDAAVFGHAKGGVIQKPAAMKVGTRVSGRQPGSLAAQFGCYYDDRSGFYTAAYDNKGYPKDFEMRRTAEGVEMNWNPHCYTEKNYEMDFDVVMTTFAGANGKAPADWRDAADIYKEWALQQPWCATPYAKRADIPVWMKDGPAMVRFGREWLAEPERIERWMTDYWKKNFPESPLITAYWGWEKIWGWVTPDYFPVFPSDSQFTNLVSHLRAKGCHAFPWPSGYHWSLTYRKQSDGSFFWDDRKRFDEVARAHAIHQRDGKLYLRTPSWLAGGDTACMCPGDPWTINWWNNDICVPLAKRGCDMIQVDQVVGGGFPFCYKREHAHPPGPGLWMTDVFNKQLRTMFTECRKVERDSIVCVEEPNEQFNHLVGIQDYRDCEAPREWASVFNYLYHEFLPTFQSNPRGEDTVMTAYCLANGQIPHMVPSMRVGGTALMNGDFERRGIQQEGFAGWDHVRGYQGQVWNGRASIDGVGKHGGATSLRLDNVLDSDVVQVSQNVAVSDSGFTPNKKYCLSAWMKTGNMSKQSSIGFGIFAPGTKSMGAGGGIKMPAAGEGWTRGSANFTVPAGAAFLRIMIHVAGKATVWVDDVMLDEVREDGTLVPVMLSPYPPDHKLMLRWVELYHGEGRPWLQFGRMLHPPKLTCATIKYHDRTVPAVLHNAFRSPDGQEAVVVANATREPQHAVLLWKNRELNLDLNAGDAALLK